MDEFDDAIGTQEGEPPLANIDPRNPDAQTILNPEPQIQAGPVPHPEPVAAPAERIVNVTDTTTTPRYHTRKHEIVVDEIIKEYTFKFGRATPMPFAHAMKFLHIPSFECRHPDGTLIPALPDVAGRGNSGAPPALLPDEVIAKLDELTEEALVRRCNAISGGEQMTVTSGKDSLVRFLVNKETRKQEAEASKREGEVEVDAGVTMRDEPAGAELDRLFDGMRDDA